MRSEATSTLRKPGCGYPVSQFAKLAQRPGALGTGDAESGGQNRKRANLAQAAEQAGLNREAALIAAAHALGDGILYWRESGLSLDELLHEAATPGGIAAATMAAMDQAGYARVVAKGVAAGVGQARRNAGNK